MESRASPRTPAASWRRSCCFAERLAYFGADQATVLLDRYREVERMLGGLIRSLERK